MYIKPGNCFREAVSSSIQPHPAASSCIQQHPAPSNSIQQHPAFEYTHVPKMAKYITEVAVSLNETEESQFRAEKFTLVPGDLNKGAGGNVIHLWYKKGDVQPITRIQFSFTDDMAKGLSEAGYTKIDKDLNAGAGGAQIYLWYYSGTTKYDVPMDDFHISTDVADEAAMARFNWEKRACNLNKSTGSNNVFLWVKRTETVYICDVIGTSGCESDATFFEQGYIRMDQNTNEVGGNPPVFIWYLQSPETSEAVKDLKTSKNDEEFINLQKQGYIVINMALNHKYQEHQVLLWYIKNGSNPIKGFTYITETARDLFKGIGAKILEPSLHSYWHGESLYMCFYQ